MRNRVDREEPRASSLHSLSPSPPPLPFSPTQLATVRVDRHVRRHVLDARQPRLRKPTHFDAADLLSKPARVTSDGESGPLRGPLSTPGTLHAEARSELANNTDVVRDVMLKRLAAACRCRGAQHVSPVQMQASSRTSN